MQFLQQFYIAKATIKGIGRNRQIVLRSYGIETAADVQQSRIQQISGFGTVITGSLVAWRTSIERRFVFKQNQPISPIDIANIKNAIIRRKSELETKLRKSLANFERTSNEVRSVRNSLQAAAVQIWNTQKQAEVDKTALAKRFSIQMRLAGIGAVMVVAFILLNAIESTVKPTSAAPSNIQRQQSTTSSIRDSSNQQNRAPETPPPTKEQVQTASNEQTVNSAA